MKLVRCTIGHYYDSEKFIHCPQCYNKEKSDLDNDVTMLLKPEQNISDNEEHTMLLMESAWDEPADTDDRTCLIESRFTNGLEPIVGWLVGLTGLMCGDAFPIKNGTNHIGRGMSMDVVLYGDTTIKKETHAIVMYDSEKRNFMLQPSDKDGSVFFNDKLVTECMVLKKNDVITVGNSKLMLIPLCDECFSWEEYI